MVTVFLMGVASGDWLPLLAFLIGLGAIVQFIDWSIHAVKKWHLRKLHRLEETILNDAATDDSAANNFI